MPRPRRGKETSGMMTLFDAENEMNPEYLIDTRVDGSMRSAVEVAAWIERVERTTGLDTTTNIGYEELLKFARQNPLHKNHKEHEKDQEERHRHHQAQQKIRHEREEKTAKGSHEGTP